jgi:lipopolysaccharide transport system ATP-binding protein
VFRSPPKSGAVYPCLYLSKQELDCLSLPEGSRYFVVIRDLRDSLISGYFSLRYSHGAESTHIERHRYALNKMSEEDGLLYLFASFADRIAGIQRSWLEAGVECLRLEDFMADPAGQVHSLFHGTLNVAVDHSRVRELTERHSFEKLSGGRRAGQEDTRSHYRKGVQGDWQLHFTPRVKDRFKRAYNDVLVRAGYERDDSW